MASTTSTDFGAALSAAIAGGYVAQLSGGTYTVSQPIVIHINSTIEGPLGIDGGGATLVSTITNGAPVIEIDVGPGVDLRYLDLSNFNITGNGQEGDGIKIVANGNDRWDYNWTISNVNVSHVGGYGLDMQGSIFEGLVLNSEMNNDGLGGASISNSADGGVASALRWFGGGFENNNGPGLTLDNGTRDITVDGATIAANNGAGISAMSGITSVTDSTFRDNHGDGVMFQNYGNFNDDTFTTSGSQTVGISGYIGSATLVDNTSAYTGSGADPTTLANLQGQGSVLNVGNTGSVVTGANLATAALASTTQASVSVSTEGVTLPALAPVTAADSAPFSSPGSGALATAMQSAFAANTLAHITSATSYTVTTPIVIDITRSSQGPVGIDLGGARIESSITNGAPVIEIVVAPGVNVGSLTLSNFSISGNGSEGDGIKVVADGTDRSVQLNLDNVDVEHVGGIGLDVLGNVQGTVTDSWMNGDAQGGARFANSANGGVASGLEWIGGGFRLNGVAGMILDNGAHDMSVSGAYFVENSGPGIDATSGITSVLGSGFENNVGSGAVVQGGGSSNFTDDTFSTYGPQTTAIGGYLSGGQVNLTGDGTEYYGSGSDPTVLANVQGQGTLAISGGGNVVAGPNVAVTGAAPSIDPPALGGTTSQSDAASQPAISTLNSSANVAVDGASLTSGTSADLVTSDGSWSFGAATTTQGGHAILLNGQLAANGYATELVIDASGHLFAEAADTTVWAWTGTAWQQTAAPSAVSAGSLSAAGSSLTPGSSADLVNSDGTWSFGAATTAQGGHAILLDGQLAANGYATELVIDANGHVFANAADSTSWEWTGTAWQQISGSNSGTAGSLSADGSSLTPAGSGNLVTADGIWSFGAASTAQGGHAILLNGQPIANGYANELVVDANGHVFANAADTTIWEWSGNGWSQVSTDLATLTPASGGASPGVTIAGNGESFVFSSANQMGGTIENFSPQLDTIDIRSLLASSKVASGDPSADGVITYDASGADSTTLHLHTADGQSYALVTLDHVAPGAIPHSDVVWS